VKYAAKLIHLAL